MLDIFIKTAYAHEVAEREERQYIELLKKLPKEELYKIASGGPLSYEQGADWLEKFKGSPLFEQAMQLEQEGIQLEVASQQQRAMDQGMWQQRDRICLKKRLLELQLMQQSAGAPPGAAAMAPPPPAAAPAPTDPVSQDGSPSANNEQPSGQPKTISVKLSGAGREFLRGLDHGASRSHMDSKSMSPSRGEWERLSEITTSRLLRGRLEAVPQGASWRGDGRRRPR